MANPGSVKDTQIDRSSRQRTEESEFGRQIHDGSHQHINPLNTIYGWEFSLQQLWGVGMTTCSASSLVHEHWVQGNWQQLGRGDTKPPPRRRTCCCRSSFLWNTWSVWEREMLWFIVHRVVVFWCCSPITVFSVHIRPIAGVASRALETIRGRFICTCYITRWWLQSAKAAKQEESPAYLPSEHTKIPPLRILSNFCARFPGKLPPELPPPLFPAPGYEPYPLSASQV